MRIRAVICLALVVLIVGSQSGCAIARGTSKAVGKTISTTAGVVGTTVGTTTKVVGKTIKAVAP